MRKPIESGSIIRIAYADDHHAVRKAIGMLIQSLGDFKVETEASNGREMIEKLEKNARLPDICLLDISMPEMNGFDTLIELKKKWPGIKVIIFTVFDSELYIIKMMMNGANGFLLKSCEPAELKRALVSVHQTGMYHSETVSNHFLHAAQNGEMPLPVLSAKEIEVLKYSCSDLSYEQIAEKMNTTARSVDGYRDNLFRKLNVHSRVSLVMVAIKFGVVTLEMKKYNQSIY